MTLGICSCPHGHRRGASSVANHTPSTIRIPSRIETNRGTSTSLHLLHLLHRRPLQPFPQKIRKELRGGVVLVLVVVLVVVVVVVLCTFLPPLHRPPVPPNQHPR